MSYAAAILADSPFSYYHLNETSGTNAADSSGNGHNATYTGTVTLNQTGRIVDVGNAAVTLDGSTGYVSCPSTGVPTANAAWTQEAWFKVNSHTSLGVIVGWGTNTTLEEPNFYVDSSGTLFMSTWNTDTTVQALTNGVWYHVVATWDGTTHTCYVNGASKVTSTPGTVATPASPAFTIGRNPNPSEFFSAITIQEVAVYATCLSSARVLAHYNAGITVTGSATLGANATIAESAQITAPVTAQANAIVSESAQVLATAVLAAIAVLSESAQVLATVALASIAAVSESAQIVTPATLAAQAVLTDVAQVQAVATLVGLSSISEAAMIVAGTVLVANAVLSGSGFAPSTATVTVTPTATVVAASRPTATVTSVIEPSATVIVSARPSAVISRL